MGPPLSVLQESLLLHKPCCPLHIEGGYSCGPLVLFVSLSLENQVDQGPRHHTIPIVVAGQSQLVTRHKYPIIHGPSKAVDVSKVHPWVCISQCVTLLFLASAPLRALAQCYLKNLICHHTLHIKIVHPQLLEDKEEFIK